MVNNFWLKLKTPSNSPFSKGGEQTQPILALAPMAGVTDSAFRQICKYYGADVVYTEMVSADGLYYDSQKTLGLLKFKPSEQPVVIQLFGKNPATFIKAAKICENYGFDGIDINFGCPAKKVVAHGGGVTLMRDLSKCRELIEATLSGTKLPVSVKLRTSINNLPLTPSFVRRGKVALTPSFVRRGKVAITSPFVRRGKVALTPSFIRRGKVALTPSFIRRGKTSVSNYPPPYEGVRPGRTGRSEQKRASTSPSWCRTECYPGTGQEGVSSNYPPPYEGGGQEGVKRVTALDFVRYIKDLPIAAIMVHGRSQENPFGADIDYEMIKAVKQEFSQSALGGKGIVLGNGGIKTPEDAKMMIEKTGVDGLGLARGLYGRPWLFEQISDYLKKGKYKEYSQKDIKKAILRQAKFALEDKGEHGLVEFRKHLLWYVSGWPAAKSLRSELVKVETLADIKKALNF